MAPPGACPGGKLKCSSDACFQNFWIAFLFLIFPSCMHAQSFDFQGFCLSQRKFTSKCCLLITQQHVVSTLERGFKQETWIRTIFITRVGEGGGGRGEAKLQHVSVAMNLL